MKGHISVRKASILGLSLWVMTSMAASDPEIAHTVSGGYWEHGGNHGHFRVLIRQVGFEHIGSQVTAEWIAEPESRQGTYRVHLTKQLVGHFLGSMGAPVLTPGRNEIRVKLKGEFTQFPDQTATCEYLLKADGIVLVVRECS
jgi:hypothetical protein